MKIATPFSLCTPFVACQFFTIDFTMANEWGLEMQPMELDCTIASYYITMGRHGIPSINKFKPWLDDIYGFDDNNTFAVGAQGAILQYDGKS